MGIRKSSNAHLEFCLPLHRIASFDPVFKIGIHQHRILVTQIVQGLGGKCGTASCLAVDIDLGVLIRDLVPDIELQCPSGDIDRSGKMSCCILIGVSDIEDDSLLLLINGCFHVRR